MKYEVYLTCFDCWSLCLRSSTWTLLRKQDSPPCTWFPDVFLKIISTFSVFRCWSRNWPILTTKLPKYSTISTLGCLCPQTSPLRKSKRWRGNINFVNSIGSDSIWFRYFFHIRLEHKQFLLKLAFVCSLVKNCFVLEALSEKVNPKMIKL